MEDVLKIANSSPLWFICAGTVLITLIQSILYLRLSKKTSAVLGISKERCNKAFKTGVIASIGPSISVFIIMVGLMAVIGGPISWMRLSIIGAAQTELVAANFGAQAAGTELGSPGYDKTALIVSYFTMALNGCGWLLLVAFFGHKIDIVRKKVGGTTPQALAVFVAAAMVALYGNLSVGSMMVNTPTAVSVLAAGISMLLLLQISKKYSFLREYNLGIAMLVGMAVATVVGGM